MDATYPYIEGMAFRAGSLPVWEADDLWPNSAMTPASFRRHARIGGMRIEVRDFGQACLMPLKATQATVMLVAVLEGRARFSCGEDVVNLSPGMAMLVACDKHVTAEWQAQSRGLCVSMQRVHLQAVASAAFREPKRLATVNLRFCHEQMPELFLSVEWLGAQMAPGIDAAWPHEDGFEIVFLSDVIRSIAAADTQVDALPVARSVKCATDFIQAQSGRNCGLGQLASIAGVTQATLVKSFKACLGVSIKDYVTDVRLNIAHASLVSGNDSRPISDIAQSSGFDHVSGFSRLYQKRFGETPSQTRAKAVCR